MIKKAILFVLSSLAAMAMTAQDAHDKHLAVPALTEGWYVQVGLDMSLQHPYQIGLTRDLPDGSQEHILKAGRTQGLVVAAGRWFTSGLGLRARVNWENGFSPLCNHNATWLNFLNSKGNAMLNEGNGISGGYLSVVGDVQFDVHGLFFPYREDRLWHLQVFPRAGLVYNIALSKGSPLIGAGLGNTWKLSPRYSLFFDIAYQMVSSGFNGRSTDVGTGSNGYLDATIGLQFNLGHHQ